MQLGLQFLLVQKAAMGAACVIQECLSSAFELQHSVEAGNGRMLQLEVACIGPAKDVVTLLVDISLVDN